MLDPGKGKVFAVDQVVVEKGVVIGRVHDRIQLYLGYVSLERLNDRLCFLREVVIAEEVCQRNYCWIVLAASVS